MKPFSFYDKDEQNYKERLQKTCEPPQFTPFKANPIKWKSQVNMYEDMMERVEKEREERRRKRAQDTLNAAKLPPRMEMHEKNKKIQEQDRKLIEEHERELLRKQAQSFKAKEVPNFQKLQEEFLTNLEKKKKAAQRTEPQPFTFHEPKKKPELHTFLDGENNPQEKNPQNRKDIEAIIKKMQKKPQIEPATTKALALLMETRRKELEAQKKEE